MQPEFLSRQLSLASVALLVLAACGDRATIRVSAPGSMPQEVCTATHWRLLSVGYRHSCGLTATGRAYCWGFGETDSSSSAGAIGDGNAASPATAVEVAGNRAFRQISAGAGYSCGAAVDGTGYCWGNNNKGQLGNGTTTASLVPIAVSGGLRFVAVYANATLFDAHTCGLTDDGVAYCWGDNRFGTLGTGGTSGNPVPTPVAVSGGLTFTQLAVSHRHTCGVTRSGTAYCWGQNTAGEVGDGTNATPRPSPRLVVGDHVYSQVVVGSGSSCGLATDGQAYCWGWGGNGNLGTSYGSSMTPRPVEGGDLFRSLSTGAASACGVTTAGVAKCWGDDAGGALGDGMSGFRRYWLTPIVVLGALPFDSVVVGGSQVSCGVTGAGAAYCWGTGYLGSGTGSTSSSVPARVIDQCDSCPIEGDLDLDGYCGAGDCNDADATIHAPVHGRCEHVDSDGDGVWDDGDGSGVAGDRRCTGGATTGCDDNCPNTANANQADSDGDGWGDACGCQPAGCNAKGKNCGTVSDGCGATIDCGACSAPQSCGGGGLPNECGCTPTTCAAQGAECGTVPDGCGGLLTCGKCGSEKTCGGKGIANKCGYIPVVSAGPDQTVAPGTKVTLYASARDDDGEPITYAWRMDNRPAGSQATLSSTTVARPTFVPDLAGVYLIELTVSDGHEQRTDAAVITVTTTPATQCALTSWKEVTGGYSNSCGVTASGTGYCWGAANGDGSTTMRLVPTAIAGGQLFRSVVAGTTYSCGVSRSGEGYCWGTNTDGTVGDGTTVFRYTPTPVSGGLRFKRIYTGRMSAGVHTCGLTTTGDAYCWGNNWSGKLGNGTTTSSTMPVAVGGGLKFRELAVGGDFTCGVTTIGSLYCWGYSGYYGGLGNGLLKDSATPVRVASTLEFSSITAGLTHACAITTRGEAYCWGFNSVGLLGTGSTQDATTPALVSGGKSWKLLTANSTVTCGVTTTGEAYCWGMGSSGQLGNGASTDSKVPVPVSGGIVFERINAGQMHVCGVAATGEAYCWGYGYWGALGVNGNTNFNTPQRVVDVCESWPTDEVDSTPPALVIDSPPSSLLGPEVLVSAKWSDNDQVDPGSARIELDGNDVTASLALSVAGAQGKIRVSGGAHLLHVACTDYWGNSSEQTRTFEVDATPPKVSIVLLPTGAQ